MKWPIFFSLFVTFNVQAGVSAEHVNSMLDQMVTKDVISKEEAEKAKARMRSMNSEQWGQINQQLAKIATRSPASAIASENKIEEVHGIDLDSAQFIQIQNDIGKIVPQYRH